MLKNTRAMVETLSVRLALAGLSSMEMEIHPNLEDDPSEEGLDDIMKNEGEVVWIDQITSSSPRRGEGRAAMAQLCLLADELHCSVALNPWAQPYKDALLQDELESFYHSLGFGWRKGHVMVRRPWAQSIVNVRYDLPYLPGPNRVELVLSDTTTNMSLTKSAFVIPVLPDGSILMADNRKRGIEVPGGHLEPGEGQAQAARRETHEETGAHLGEMNPICHLRMRSLGDIPKGWRYPHPLGYQSFFCARVVSIDEYVENEECLKPRIINDLNELEPHVRLMAMRARMTLGMPTI